MSVKCIVTAVFLLAVLSGCNTAIGFSILGDLVKLRIDREAAGEGHIEDVFADKDQAE
ncbi:hypothetical protein [Desulfuromonas thiophila]|uniref:hypothetical protein n=1 Tax=Desulfuromonas thiophila TaxID=57664 RepID=UPI0029F52FC7|nr:hypothetical protein [Desulfuromonas thiophila]